MNSPNVVVFFTDTQRYDCSGLHGNPLDLMPNFDRLAMRGTHLFNFFTPQPVCTPARACLQTGTYATRNGTWRNGLGLDPKWPTLATEFNRGGYQTMYVGKWHLAPETGDPDERPQSVPRNARGGYQQWLGANVLEFCSRPYDTRLYDEHDREVFLPGYRVDALTNAAIEMIGRHRAQEPGQPFLLFLSHLEPHGQNTDGAYRAPVGTRQRYEGRWTPPDLNLPSLDPDYPHLGGESAGQMGDYWAMVKRLDDAFGRLMDALISLDIADETIVVFASDHGAHFGTRNANNKCSPHEVSIRVPGLLHGGPFTGGGRVEELTSLIDIAPTLLDACDLPTPDTMQGASMLPLVRGARANWRDAILVQISVAQISRAVRTRRWKYAVSAPQLNPMRDSHADEYVETELYDLETDPYEMINLIGYTSHRATADGLRERLLRCLGEAGEALPAIRSAPARSTFQRRVTPEEARQ